MAYSNDQKEFPLPGGSDGRRRSAQHLPRYFRTQTNNKFLSSTFDQLLQPGVTEKLNGYLGRKTAPGFSTDDFYIGDVSKEREDYQLEPAAVVKDDLNNVQFYGDYNDYINQLENLKSSVNNHSVLNQQEFYSWNPHIDWDKFVNFREYYWLPNGPQAVPVAGDSVAIQSTYTVTSQDNLDNYAFVFMPDGLTQNPELTLYRGVTYRFEVDSPGVPLSFRSNRIVAPEWTANTYFAVGETVLYERQIYTAVGAHRSGENFEENQDLWSLNTSLNLVNEVDNQGVEKGIIELTLFADSPDFIYYVSDSDINAGGLIRVYDNEEAAFINVNEEILGKQTYTTGAGFDLSNGMKIEFQGTTVPEKYQQGAWYVEGVGTAIKLISEDELNISSNFVEDEAIDFDTEGFDTVPYSRAIGFPREKDYFTINRASQDGNLWSKYNRWFHRSIIESAAEINGTDLRLDQTQRAIRPIIEFEPNLKLFDFGTLSKTSVDLVDDFTTDVFSTIEGSEGYNIDGVSVSNGMRILFNADTDIRVNRKIYTVEFITFQGRRQIALRETADTQPLTNQTVLCKQGSEYTGKILYFTGETWKQGQQKNSVNQAPLFDVFDCDGFSLADPDVYQSSTFVGTKLFSYAQGNGIVDSELDIPLLYRSIQNVGDIVFDFNLTSDAITFCPTGSETRTESTGIGFLKQFSDLDSFVYVNGYKKADRLSNQTVIRQYQASELRIEYPVDVYENSADLDDLELRVFVNNDIQTENEGYFTSRNAENQLVVLIGDLSNDDVVRLKTQSAAEKTENGFYEIPSNLERNPLNADVERLTLGEINDHVGTIVQEIQEFQGRYPGPSNLRDQGEVSQFGRRIVKHSAPLNLALYHLLDEEANLVKALKFARQEYGKFKRNFLQTAFSVAFDGPVDKHFDKIIREILKEKPDTDPFYFSDMLATGGKKSTVFDINSEDQQFFGLTTVFDLSALSERSVLVYLNGIQLVHGRDYTFNSEGFVVLSATIQRGDEIRIDEYESSNGSFVPPTPSKLGLYPTYIPKIFVDDTYFDTRTVIQGHDGSIQRAFGDFRDDLILEFEKRIYNNIKISYDTDLFDILDYIPGTNRNTSITRKQIDDTMLSDFVQWSRLVDQDYTENTVYQRDNSFTWNYTGSTNFERQAVRGTWRNIYHAAYDTDRPHTSPWEMLGFTDEPVWWEQQYGAAPYTSNNLLMWEDIEQGIIREPGKNFQQIDKYRRPGLVSHLPVDEKGNLLSPLDSNYVRDYNFTEMGQDFSYGDWSPVETAWRKSSEYPFALITSLFLNQPNRIMSTCFDRSRQRRGTVGDIIYEQPNRQIQLEKIVFPNSIKDNTRTFTSGLVNYVRDYISSSVTSIYENYKNNLQILDNQIGAKLAGYTSTEKFNLILDSRSPLNEGNVFVPAEDYQIFLNTSTPLKTLYYSGVIIQKQANGYVVRGYNEQNPVFEYTPPRKLAQDSVVTIGGISATAIDWTANSTFTSGTIVEFRNNYYRTITSHVSENSFDEEKFQKLASLPVEGGQEARLRKEYFDDIETVPYGYVFRTIQDVVDFVLGYGNYLETQGFVFDYYDPESGLVADWITSVKEFLFWTTQNWGEGSVISLSPGAFQLKLESQFSAVDDIYDTFYGYSLLKVDGEKFQPDFVSLTRQEPNEFIIKPKNTADGIFGIRIALVQTEHALLIDNRTQFGDIIYDQPAGYRQERIRVLGYRTTDWDGSLNIPGFIYDDVKIKDWQQWQDYDLGEVVRYKEFFYAAKDKVAGSQVFNDKEWFRLDERPESKLIPNFEYKINQFADFYDLDSDNFDSEQQKFAQHLIGYQNREYLANIINDDVSQYKFYQGFIQDKGTQNAFTKLFEALGSPERDSLEFYEEWAIKSGQYGAADGFEEVEYILDESQFKTSPQPVQLVNESVAGTDLVARILPYETYLKPKNYTHAPFPQKIVTDTFVKNSGFVDPKDIDFTVNTYQDIAELDVDEIDFGAKIWVGNVNNSWNVYTATRTDSKIDGVEQNDAGNGYNLSITTTDFEIEVDEIIAIFNLGSINGVYVVNEIDNATIKILSDSLVSTPTGDISGRIMRFTPSRFTTVSDATENADLIEQGLDRLWIDKTQNEWKVIDRKSLFGQQDTIEPQSNTAVSYGTAIDSNKRNTVLVVGDPDNQDGEVSIYTRIGSKGNFTIAQTIKITPDLADAASRFGASVAVSETGDYIAVGSPDASNVSSTFRGDYVEQQDYVQGSIVQREDNLWQAEVDILGAVNNIEFGSFESVPQILLNLNLTTEDSESIPVLLAGNYPFQNQTADHFVVKAPRDMYDGSGVGDTVKLKWNTQSYAYQSVLGLPEIEPFDGTISQLDSNFLTQGHVIAEKIDSILFVNASTNIPNVGQIVETQTAFGTVAYTYNEGAQVTIYIKEQNGDFGLQGSITTGIGEFVGEYETQAPREQTLGADAAWGGFWKIDTDTYTVASSIDDEGRGLIYTDVVPQGSTDTDRIYFNVLDFESDAFSSFDTRNSELTSLTYEGLPGPGGVSGVFESSLYVLRAPKPLTDFVSIGEEVEIFYNSLREFETGDFLDPTTIGLSVDEISRKHEIQDLWDGYIDFEITKNLSGVPIEPKVGITVRDVTNLGTGEVTFYQRFNTTSARIYVKNVQGTWALGNDFGENREIEFLADGSDDPLYDPAAGSRVFGQIQSRSLGYELDGIGQLVVLETESADPIELQNKDRILNSEYWFYREDTVLGIPREPNLPAENNNDWRAVYNIPAGVSGEASGLTREGLFSIYERTGTSQWTKINDFVVPQRKDNNRLGAELEFSEINDLTKLFVKAAGDSSADNFGKIFVIKNGNENQSTFNWDLGRSKQYKGEFSDTRNYSDTDVVFYQGKIYRSQTNISAGAFNQDDWVLLDSPVDYLGFIPNDVGLVLDDTAVLDTDGLLEFARDFDSSANGEVIVTSAIYDNTKPNKLLVYRNLNGLYVKTQEISAFNNEDEFGNSLALSSDGRYIAIGAPLDDSKGTNTGAVYLYSQQNGEFKLAQKLTSIYTDQNEQFGFRVSFDGNILAVGAKSGDSFQEAEFDQGSTVFDGEFTRFRDYNENAGIVQIFELFENAYLYAQTIDFDNDLVRYFGRNLHVKNNQIYVGMPRLQSESSPSGSVVNYSKPANKTLWSTLRSIKPTVDVNKIKRVSLYDTKKNKLIQYLDYIDPLQGKIAGIAEQEISYKLFYDPAVYTQGANVQVDETNSWGKKQVGEIWWDLTNTKFLNPYQGSIINSANSWSTLFSNINTVDVYEWVESRLLPDEWDAQSGTERGFTRGITGTTRYGNSAYVTKRLYDQSSQTFSTRYYYWVRSKQTVPNIENRNISAQDIADLIRDPQGEGYRYVSLISPTEFALYNCNSLINDRDVAISVQYWTIDDQTINIHNQYEILTEGLSSSRPNQDVEQKWFDSLVGYDSARRQVPAPELSNKQKYGILNTPRQGWFVNRIEALKQVVERVNRVLENTLVVDERDISRLTEQEPQPSQASRTYDTSVETRQDLDFVGIARARQAILSVVVENGRLQRVNIEDSGRGYLVAPTVEVLGTGEGAEVSVEIDNQGKVISATIDSAGEYHQTNTPVTVRRFTVLVENDETIDGKWALFERDTQSQEWVRTLSQGYDVSKYWEYVNWYDTGYSEFTEINHVIDASYELQSLEDEIGEVVKIESIGSGGWLLLEKIDNQDTTNYAVNYNTIGRQNGTLQFLPTLYDLSSSLTGFDAGSFDDINYDGLPTTETRIILETIRDFLFTDDLASEYNNLFFASLRYVFSEQNYVDWAFKTSFIKAQHNVGELEQKISFKNDNLPSYEAYVNEVKPYSANIREYLSAYEKLENTRSMTTDFDLPPRFSVSDNTIQPVTSSVVDNAVIVQGEQLDDYPDLHWLDNLGYSVDRVAVTDPGSGYTSAPVVTISGGGGSGAKAEASIGVNGRVTQITVTDPGRGYLSSPEININGSIRDDGTPATATAQISGSPVRSMHTIIKFDRISGDFEYVNLNTVEQFAGTGSKTEYELEWPMDLRTTKVRVFIDGSEALGGIYSYENILDTSKGYDRFKGKITFENAPANGKLIQVEYSKSLNLLNAQDRIAAEYEPTIGQLGKSLGQLMEGIDYGGVEVTSFGFESTSGWGSQPWGVQSWDVFDTTFEDEIIQLDGSTISIELSKPLERDTTYNIYRIARDLEGNIVSNKRMDDPNFGTSEQTNSDAVTESIQGDGSTTILYLDELNIPTTPESATEEQIIIIVRKITSDGSIIPDPESFDTQLEGGDLAYQTATGLRAEDINVDGDGFVTETTSKGPEEVVPGQVLDTLDIQVFETPTDGASTITARNYIADGASRVYSLGTVPVKQENVFVKINNQIQQSAAYAIDYQTGEIVFSTAPTETARINLVTLGNSASEIRDIESFIGDGETGEFLTNVEFASNIEALATVNGKEEPFTLLKSDNSYDKTGNIVVKFATPPETNATINLVLVTEGLVNTNYSVVETDQFTADGSSVAYTLSNNIFARQPALAFTIVKVNNTVLNAGYNQSFTVSDQREYQLDLTQIPVGSISANEIEVYLNDTKLEVLQQWQFEGAGLFEQGERQPGSTVILEPGIGNTGDTLRVFVLTDSEYRFGFFENGEFVATRGEDSTLPVLHLDQPFNDGDSITVYNFSNHDSQGIERQSLQVEEKTETTPGTEAYFEYRQLERGIIQLRKPAATTDQVWVVRNGELLSPSVDYAVSADSTQVILMSQPDIGDRLETIHFANSRLVDKFGWRQFKDMLNRTHYKRLSLTQRLASDLKYDDKTIQLDDASDLPEPDYNTRQPGIIFIDKERIEYFFKDGNILKQLRRGTLGTGIKDLYVEGTAVMEQGKTHNLPYADTTDTQTFIGDDTTFAFETKFTTDSVNDVEVFVAGRRLRKQSLSVFDKTLAQDSPEGDRDLPAEFDINNGVITLATTPSSDTRIIVSRKTGTTWKTPGDTLAQADTDVARFLRAGTTDLPR